MSGTGNTAGGKRKRRTFWEPESERLVAWLDAQADLGTSLQLIIVDAIKKYGEGDVIKAHLKQREYFFYEEAPHQPRSVRTESSVQDDVGDEDNQESTLSFDSEPKVDQSPIRDLGHEPEAENEAEPELESDVQIDTDSDKPVGNNANSIAESSDKEQKEEEAKYDPIAILMRDSGSTLND
ncbi:hypothetical protein CHH61_03515 [Shouchella clausii]|uniref:Uncharacterized protein n=1 Tax=Shouchella clausii TaxID=79880 RepID=A0A268S4H8_SHOCL|nr:hypothetical protein [Shouchella clausii]PAF27400.1 hypothetical protein CHH61_03515 [Shouchella clausii]